ncbi:prepilin-type N-terminal cleavage/methylation domain-containing protein [Candidatus Saccharibacteria bacterium]|nr:prepilin-type N-terminal cleavage/methylation domain-containing protein [Candidatus Saccharibacteria bacterium]MBH1972415.1 prepilin-type N-terminal cleavage/methylation domain-containing protein [Candidatus Saccharibacteria bacterium]MBH1990243.1 prepilin-type N-terminal cleavage/methylation domain-containing protein [Candidatus Saccharibacteria bacterium]
MKSQKRSGFTIVELLIIIVVIGILATIGIVSYSGTQSRSKKATFQTTADQVKLKLGEYFTDNNRYPATKVDVATYLTNGGNGDLSTKFNYGVDFSYVATPGGCVTTGSTRCTGYTITVLPATWGGRTSDPNIIVNNS